MKSINDKLVDDFFLKSNADVKSKLCILMEKFGSDKCSAWHNYSSFYNFIFSEDCSKELKIFEVGIYGGSSVKAWQEYFYRSQIFCGDVNPNYFINEGRIQSFFCDQDNPDSIQEMWNLDPLDKFYFDVIIDDGKHEFQSNLNFLENSYHKLKDGGIFIIEDLTRNTFHRFEEISGKLKEKLNPSFMKLISINNPNNFIDNNILIIQK